MFGGFGIKSGLTSIVTSCLVHLGFKILYYLDVKKVGFGHQVSILLWGGDAGLLLHYQVK